MMSEKITTRSGVSAEWLGGWATIIRQAHEEAGNIQAGGENKTEFMAAISVYVVPSCYSTSPDGRDWADGQNRSPGIVHVRTYDEGSESDVRCIERWLLESVVALENLPSGMGTRHGEIKVSVRTDGKRPVVYRSWTVAEEIGRGVQFAAVPEKV
jgi:hypothetical protein